VTAAMPIPIDRDEVLRLVGEEAAQVVEVRVGSIVDLASGLLEDNEEHVAACCRIDD
jgi:hypothetical protein